ncbi:MliC family protein [Candidatus Kaiserbacteria bacterium]|nr:MliC family protein [Candidatus Kaiserbacteria bacterium]
MSAMWQGVIAVLLIAMFVALAGLTAYELYGPGIRFELPDYLLPAGWATTTDQISASDPLAAYRGILFLCADQKALRAEFMEGAVNLALSDGRQIRLTQVIAGGRERYANTDESFVFWTKGITAFVEEGSVQTYTSCLQQ